MFARHRLHKLGMTLVDWVKSRCIMRVCQWRVCNWKLLSAYFWINVNELPAVRAVGRIDRDGRSASLSTASVNNHFVCFTVTVGPVWLQPYCISNQQRPSLKHVKGAYQHGSACRCAVRHLFNPLNAELNPICRLLALLGVHHFLHVSRIRVKSLILRLLMSYIYIWH